MPSNLLPTDQDKHKAVSCNPLCKPASPPSAIAVESPVLLQSDEPIGETSEVVPSHPCVQAPVCDPELFASQLLLQDAVERRNLCALLHALPKEDSQTAGAGKFPAGVYQHGGVASMWRACDSYPNTIRVLNLFVSPHVDVSYNALVVIDNLASPMRRDVLNQATPHWVIPVGAFSGGGVWQQDATGAEQRVAQGKLTNGSILSLSEPACLRASTCFHQTEPWEGDRLLIVVFTVKLATLASSAVRHLMSLGFPLPLSTGDCAATPEPAKFACLDAAAAGIPLIVEVFAGSARITECCREVGLRADAVDHKPHALSKVQPLLLDLTSDIGRRSLRSILAHPDLKAIWWAPPCGTASKARCIPSERRSGLMVCLVFPRSNKLAWTVQTLCITPWLIQ